MTRSGVDELLYAVAAGRVQHVEKPWGREYVLRIGDALLKVIRVNEGCRTSRQHHERKREVIVALDGAGTIEGTADERNLFKERPSRPYVIRPGVVHRSVGPLLLLEITTDDDDDVVRHEDDYGREDV